jgi:hypothetical protein
MTIDYAINSVVAEKDMTTINLQRIGQMGMPIDLKVKLKSGETLLYNIPMTKMRGSKPLKNMNLLDSWSWAKPYYSFTINVTDGNISEIIIDPKGEMADVDRVNNSLSL